MNPTLIKWPVFPKTESKAYDPVESLKKQIGRDLAKLKNGELTLPKAGALISSAIEQIIQLTEKRVKEEAFIKALNPIR